MKAVRLALAAVVCCAPLLALAQWQWLDKDGRKVFSDQAPPADVPANRILKQPGVRAAPATTVPAATPVAAPAAAAPASASGRDKGLEDKRRQAEAAAADKKKAEEARVAAVKAENCARAQEGKRAIDSGMRMARVNDKGEREVLDDSQRAAQARQLQAVIERDCR